MRNQPSRGIFSRDAHYDISDDMRNVTRQCGEAQLVKLQISSGWVETKWPKIASLITAEESGKANAPIRFQHCRDELEIFWKGASRSIVTSATDTFIIYYST